MNRSDYVSYLEKNGYVAEHADRQYTFLESDLDFYSKTQEVKPEIFFKLFPVLEERLSRATLEAQLKACITSIRYSSLMIRNALRYLDLWKEYVDVDTQKAILTKLIEEAPLHDGAKYVAFHAHQLDTLYGTDPTFTKMVGAYIRKYRAVLPLLSFYAIDDIPGWVDRDLLQNVTKDPLLSLPNVHAIRRVEQHVGDCSDAEDRWYMTVHGKTKEGGYGRCAVVHLDGTEPDMPLAAVKLEGAENVLALQTVRAEDGSFPLIKGGMYALNRQGYKQIDLPMLYGKTFPIVHTPELAARPLRLLGATDIPPGMSLIVEDILSTCRKELQKTTRNWLSSTLHKFVGS